MKTRIRWTPWLRALKVKYPMKKVWPLFLSLREAGMLASFLDLLVEKNPTSLGPLDSLVRSVRQKLNHLHPVPVVDMSPKEEKAVVSLRFLEKARKKGLAVSVQIARLNFSKSITVEVRDRQGERWVVANGTGQVLTRRGRWVDEPSPSERSDAFKRKTRFSFPEAVRRAWVLAEVLESPDVH